MIFLSHNSKDKGIVDQFATRLLQKYSAGEVFYDSWSIKPGESIIGSMDEGLSQTDKFVLFVSQNSLNSGMVTLEWQTALSQRAGGNMELIPVKIDDVQIPMILSQLKYIDLYTNGLEVAIQQLDNVLESSFSFSPMKFHNLVAQVERVEDENSMNVTIRATTFQEPISRFFVSFSGELSQISISVLGESMINVGDLNLNTNNGQVIPAKYVGMARAITPKFPMIIHFSNMNETSIMGVFQPMGSDTNELKSIPLTYIEYQENKTTSI